MIEFTHETTRYKTKPENAQAIRALAAKPPKIKMKIDSFDRKNDSMKREYPIFQAGMTTEDYLKCFNALNSRLLLTPWTHTHADRAAPMLDATQPEVWEEVDEHYIPTTQDIKPAKKLTTRAALVALIEACEEGDPEQIAAAVTRARGSL
tara:strand:- start:270 stop:719 length:450 start_codon:yes stop_codon:yes gene_type:complete